jgi:hypothetical protein
MDTPPTSLTRAASAGWSMGRLPTNLVTYMDTHTICNFVDVGCSCFRWSPAIEFLCGLGPGSLGMRFAPRQIARFAMRDDRTVFMQNLPGVADLFLGRALRDNVNLPTY